MKKIILSLFLAIFTFTGCRQVDTTFKGKVEIAYEEVKDDFNNIDEKVEKETNDVKNISGEDLQELTQTIQEGYEKIKEGITKENQEEAKKVYEAATRLHYIEEHINKKLTDQQKNVLGLGKNMKTLMMHYYGKGKGDYNQAVENVEQGLKNVKNYSEDQWEHLIK